MLIPIIFTILIFPGMFMTFIPLMPALPYMFLMSVTFGFVDSFERLSQSNLSILSGILLASILIDYFSGVIGAKYGGASKKGILYGFLGLIIGFFLLPPFGGFIGLFIGILIAEFILKRNHMRAFKAATGSLIGSFVGILLNTFLAFLFFVLFVLFVFVI